LVVRGGVYLEINRTDFWKSDKYLYPLTDRILSTIKMVSFDVFDTILFRTCHHPIDVFLLVAQIAKQRGILPQSVTEKEFQQIRVLAEEKARAEQKKTIGTTEVTLESIYQFMPSRFGIVAQLTEIELEVETKCCYANPSIVSLMCYLVKYNVPFVAMSDMYLSAKHIERLLTNAGIPADLFKQIIVSNEEGVGKSSGLLFKRLLDYYPDIVPETILHIGDNQVADVEGAKSEGLQALHYNIVPSRFDDVFDWEKIRTGLVLPEISSLRKLACAVSAELTLEEQKWFEIGAGVLGPFLTLFSEWIVDICEKECRKNVYPFMREGKLLTQLIVRAAQRRGIELEVKPLYISRWATTLAGLEKFEREQIENFFDRRNFSVQNFLDLLEIDESDRTMFDDYVDIFLDDANNTMIENSISLKRCLIEFLVNDRILSHVQKLIVQKRKMFIQYLRSMNMDFNDFVTVDIGFKGTIQKALEMALKNEGFHAKGVHLLAIGAEENKYHLFQGMDIRGFVGNAGENIDLISTVMRSPEVLEELIMDGTGSTIGYSELQGVIRPVLSNNQCPTEEIKSKMSTWQGIKAFQNCWFYLEDAQPSLKDTLLTRPREILEILHRLIDFPTLEETVLLGNLHHEDNFGSDSCLSICTQKDEILLNEIGPERLLERSRFQYGYGKICWPQAVITRSKPDYFFKRQLMLGNVTTYLSLMSGLVSEIQQAGFHQIVVYGAGEIGRALIKAAHLHQLKIVYIVDRKESLWGQFIDGVEIVSLQQAIDKKSDAFAIGSLAFTKEIKKILGESCDRAGLNVKIFAINI
jgi:predicted HAD superfamily hydrolase